MQSSVTTGKKPAKTHPHNWPMHLEYLCSDVNARLYKMFSCPPNKQITVSLERVPSILDYLKKLTIDGLFFLSEDDALRVEREINNIISLSAGMNNVPIKGAINLVPINMGFPLNPEYRLEF
jgi:hypothetical protein